MFKLSGKRRVVDSRLKAFASFSDSFSLLSLKSGWKTLSGTWSSTGSSLQSNDSSALITVPASKTNATTTVTVPSNQTGVGPAFWVSTAGSYYWAAYANTTTSLGASNCNNGNCSGTENYTATRNCSCSNVYGTCAKVYGTCAQTTGTCQSSPNYITCAFTTTYDTCSLVNTYGTCSYTAGSTTYSYFSIRKTSDDCSFYANTVQLCGGGQCNATNTGCTVLSTWACCKTTTVTSGSWNYSGCSYSGQQVVTGTTWNYPSAGCSYSGQTVAVGGSWNNGSCAYSGQVIQSGVTWNYSGCSSNGQTVVTGWNYSGCSSVGASIDLGYNYGGCSYVGQSVVIGQSSNCNNGSCSGSENYTATRSCSCPTNTNRIIKIIKSISGVISTVGTFVVGSTPTTITATTNGTDVTISASGSSQSFTNSDGTVYNGFGVIKNDGGIEQGSSASTFSVTVN